MRARREQVLVGQAGRAAKPLVEAPEHRLPDPFAMHPGVERRLVTEPDLDQALTDGLAREDHPNRIAGVDEDAAPGGRDGEGGLHLLEPFGREALALEE